MQNTPYDSPPATDYHLGVLIFWELLLFYAVETLPYFWSYVEADGPKPLLTSRTVKASWNGSSIKYFLSIQHLTSKTIFEN